MFKELTVEREIKTMFVFASRVLPSVLDSDEVRNSITYSFLLVKPIAIIHLWAGWETWGGGSTSSCFLQPKMKEGNMGRRL